MYAKIHFSPQKGGAFSPPLPPWIRHCAEERGARLQPRRDWLVAETADEREARLQYMRDRLAAETEEESRPLNLQLKFGVRCGCSTKWAGLPSTCAMWHYCPLVKF